jgi:F-type H+-transporting ATPase subunit a
MLEQLWFTKILNRLFGPAVAGLMESFHIHVKHPEAPIANSAAMEVLVCLFLILLFIVVRSQLSVDKPGGLQHLFELTHGFIEQQSHEIIGPHSEAHTPFLVTLALFILFCNLIGVIPGFESPTAVPIVPLGCAIVAFFYYQAQGFKHAGIKYLAHFAGPMPALAPLMIPIELISHLARVLSLTIRLFANMFAGEMVTLVFFSLVPLFVPIIFMGLHIGVAVIQTYIFVLLACVYLGEATAHEH